MGNIIHTILETGFYLFGSCCRQFSKLLGQGHVLDAAERRLEPGSSPKSQGSHHEDGWGLETKGGLMVIIFSRKTWKTMVTYEYLNAHPHTLSKYVFILTTEKTTQI